MNGVGVNSISTYLNRLKSIYKEAQRRNLGIKTDNPFEALIKQGIKKKIPDFKRQDVKSLILAYQTEKGNLRWEVYRRTIGLFLFQICIGGQDFIDVANLKWEDLYENRIRMRRFKNRNKANGGALINNHLSDFALSIIEQYADKESKRLFPFIPDPNKDIVRYNGHLCAVNYRLNSICKRLNITHFSSKSPRYIFRSFAGELFLDAFVIMQLMGHTPQGISFGYQRSLSNDILDKEHQKVLDLFFDSV